jgi:putative ABC transport system permease protein
MQWFRRLFARQRIANDLAEEIQQHLAESMDTLMADGMNRKDAEHAAKREFGNMTQIEETSREVWGWPAIESLMADVRFGLRQFRKDPVFTVVAVLSLALGIGATTVVFSIVYAVLINPYPYKGADRMAHVHIFDKTEFGDDLLLSSAQFDQFKNISVLDGAIAVDKETVSATGAELPESVSAAYLSPNAFEVFGISPLLGREFSQMDTKDDSHPANIIVLSYPYWQTHYGGSTDVIGKSLELDRTDYTIIGVLPKRFAWWPGGDVYFPLKFSPDPNRTAIVFVRIKPGVSYPAAQAALQASLKELAKQTPEHFPKNFTVRLVRLNDIFVGPFAGTLYTLFGAVGLLLVVGCVNVSILLLARGVVRTHELAVRAAIGAGRTRIVRQLLTESVALSIVGGSLGTALAYGGVGLVARLLPSHTFPGEASFRVNLPVLLFAICLATLTGIIFGLWPALHFSRPELSSILQAGSGKLSGNAGSIAVHRVLLAGQVALILVLMAAAGATVRSLYRFVHSPLGYDPENLGCITIPLRDGTYAQWDQRVAYFEQIRQKAENIPGIRSAAIVQTFLPPVSMYKSTAEIRGASDGVTTLTLQEVSPEYFSTLRIPLLSGRLWAQTEALHGAHVAIISVAMAHRYWPKGDAIGHMVHLDALRPRTAWVVAAPGNDGWVQVVGVVGDTPNNGLRDLVSPAVYVPYTLVLGDNVDLLVRTRGNPLNYVHTVREEIHTLDANQTISEVTTAEQRLETEGLSRERFIATVFVSFAFVGLVLGSVGLYSVVSYVVSQRAREFGIRMALGASRAHLVRIVVQSSAIAAAVGGGIGLAASIGLSRLVAHWTDGNLRDPLMLGAVGLIFLSVVTVASLIPARRAAWIDPMRVLRME